MLYCHGRVSAELISHHGPEAVEEVFVFIEEVISREVIITNATKGCNPDDMNRESQRAG